MEEWVIQDREEGEEVKLLHKSHMGAIIYAQYMLNIFLLMLVI